MADRQELVDALQTIPWFQELSTEHFNKLLEIAITREYEAGQVIFHEGDKEDYLYIVLEGRVAIEMSVPGRGRMRILTAEPMDVVGWSSVTPVVRQRTAGARAVLPTRMVLFNADELRKFCEEDHDFGYIFMRRMANVVASRLLTGRLQLLDMFANPGDYEEVKHG
jgi:CRP/FNR family cyclic AMP-dependent transcriptional regulator